MSESRSEVQCADAAVNTDLTTTDIVLLEKELAAIKEKLQQS